MKVSVIVTTYNWPEALRLVLTSVLAQTMLPLEIVVADDGSGPATVRLVGEFARTAPLPIIHSWQEDAGYRLAKSRNRAIAKATGTYILLIDGDIVLDRHFVADHLACAQLGCFVQGPRALLNGALTDAAFATGKLPPLLWAKGIGNRKNCLRSSLLSKLFSWPCQGLGGIRLCNFGFWKQDAQLVNGFNEEFVGWGREDSEFVARLLHAGRRRKNLKFNALGYHLHHPLNPRSHLATNDAILQKTLDFKLVRCEKGLDQYLGA